MHWEQADYNGAEVVHIHYDLASSQLFVNFSDNLLASRRWALPRLEGGQLAQSLWLSDYKHVDRPAKSPAEALQAIQAKVLITISL